MGQSTFAAEIASDICERLANGESLRAICRDEGYPAESTVRAWALDDIEGFAAQYARARELGYECLSDELLEIADTPKLGEKRKINEKGEVETTEGDMIEHRRLQVDSRKWMLSKMLPKKYGDKIALGGADDLPPIKSDNTFEPNEAYYRMLNGDPS